MKQQILYSDGKAFKTFYDMTQGGITATYMTKSLDHPHFKRWENGERSILAKEKANLKRASKRFKLGFMARRKIDAQEITRNSIKIFDYIATYRGVISLISKSNSKLTVEFHDCLRDYLNVVDSTKGRDEALRVMREVSESYEKAIYASARNSFEEAFVAMYAKSTDRYRQETVTAINSNMTAVFNGEANLLPRISEINLSEIQDDMNYGQS